MKSIYFLLAFVLFISAIGCSSYQLKRGPETTTIAMKKELSSEVASPKFDTPQIVSDEDMKEILKYLIPDDSKSKATSGKSEPASTTESKLGSTKEKPTEKETTKED
ncbi:MAG: hypothetical protein ACE5IW_07250 [bacterium]